MPSLAYLSLGSNVGDRESNLRQAITLVEQLGKVTAVSSFYETEPVEFTAQPWFLNAALALKSSLPPRELMAALLKIEQALGRQRTQPKGPRTIDLDLLLIADEIIDSPELTIPHPAMHERRFVLEPLAEIAPEAKHSLLKKTMRELLQALPAGAAVRKIKTT